VGSATVVADPALDKGPGGARAKALFLLALFFRGLKAAIPGLKSGASTRSLGFYPKPGLLPEAWASSEVWGF